MSIQLKVSNSLIGLADELCEQIKTENTVFRPIYVVTQTEGMNKWLRQRIAENLGIAANIEFLKPNDLVHTIFRLMGGSYRDTLSAQNMNWLLYGVLNEKEFKNEFPQIADYYNVKEGSSEIKRMALAQKIADLFDQYQIYRADVLKEWNEEKQFYNEAWASHSKQRKHHLKSLQNAESWQKELWIKTRKRAQESFPNKTEIGDFIINSVSDEKVKWISSRIPKIYFFGLSLITDYHLRIFEKLSELIELQFLIQNPAPLDYWFEEKSEKVIAFLKTKKHFQETEESNANPLLPSWGKIIRETFLMLFQNEETLNSYTEIDVKEPPKDTLLHHIQNTIFNNQKNHIHFTQKQIEDGTVVVNSCYSPVREVEVLYNYLVHLIQHKNENLSARDIVVMVTDIDLYASYIKAVFDNAPHKFKYTIADETYLETDNIANALVEILSLNEQQLTSEKVVSLLDFTAIKKQFGIVEVEKIRTWVKEANIRFGIYGNREDDSDFVSWKYGLKRIMYGLCISGGEEYGEGEKSFYPLDLIEGFNTVEATRFVYFVENLIQSIESRRNKRKISGWVEFMNRTLSQFIGEKEEAENDDYQLIQRQLEQYNLLDELFDEEVPYEVFIRNFLPMLLNAKKNSSFAGGGITFCSLIPMRSIPFKVVALLGMNLNNFPRKDRRMSFDLMELEKRKGDRNIRENDKHLFLETLISAGDYLYISYIGQNVKDNTALPPSALVDEFLDFISSKTENPDEIRENFVQKHPLHGFSRKYNSNNPRLYSYLLSQKPVQIDLNSDKSEEEIFTFENIELSNLISFYRNPFKYFYNRVLGIYYEKEELSLPETEVFDVDSLVKWNLNDTLLKSDESKWGKFKDEKVKTGVLPLKNMAEVILSNVLEEIAPIRELYNEVCGDFEDKKFNSSISFGNSLLNGNIDGIYDNQLLRYSLSKNEYKNKQSVYLEALFMAAAGESIDLKFISKKEEKIYNGKRISQENARNKLSELLEIFLEGHQRIIAFHPDFYDGKGLSDAAKFNKKIQDLMNNEYFHPDAYLMKEYQNGFFENEEVFKEFSRYYEALIESVEDFFE